MKWEFHALNSTTRNFHIKNIKTSKYGVKRGKSTKSVSLEITIGFLCKNSVFPNELIAFHKSSIGY